MKKNNKKETVLFVHGAWHGKWCWDKYFKEAFFYMLIPNVKKTDNSNIPMLVIGAEREFLKSKE